MARVVTFGEIMMRLAAPGHERLAQAHRFDVTYAGAEANVAVSATNFGHSASFVTALPEGPLGDAAIAAIQSHGVGVSHVQRDRSGRLGLYFLEAGASQRPSRVVYDRGDSSMARLDASAYDWSRILAGANAFHTTGITPALSESCRAAADSALATAKHLDLHTSLDLNYRAKLWSPEQAQAVISPLLANVELVIGNEDDAATVLGVHAEHTEVEQGKIDRAAYEKVGQTIRERYGVKRVAITLRESESATINHWSACLVDDAGFFLSRRYTIHVVDRVGAGDAFVGGLLSALLHDEPPADALEFAVAASCLKHSIPGDFNRVTPDEVRKLVGGEASGRVVR